MRRPSFHPCSSRRERLPQALLGACVLAGCSTLQSEERLTLQGKPSTLAVQPPPAEVTTPDERATAAQSAPKDTVAAATAAEESFPIHGSLNTRYRVRSGAGAGDQDLYQSLLLDVGDRKRDGYSAHVMATLFADLDGRRDRDDQFVFPSLADTFNEPVQPLLYQAYVDIDKPPLVNELRVGRQFDYFTPEFAHFDGVRAATAPVGASKLVGGVYGGVPVRLYDATESSDSIFGLWGEAQPWSGGRARVDWMHVDDDDRFGVNSNDLLGATLWQRISASTRVDARYTRLENEDRDVRLRANWDDAELDARLQVSFYQLLETQRNFANEFDPLFSVLQEWFPFAQYRVQGSKGLGEDLRVDASLDFRRVADDADEGPFNRNFERQSLSLIALDVLAKGLTFTLTADLWNSDGRDIQTWGVDATRDLRDGLRWSLGSNYALYRYDLFSNSERDNVRVWYARLRRDIGRWGVVDLRYDLENFDGETYHVVLAGVTWRF
ncbi:MAG: hypothetical protein JNN27_18815 [Planctomycetes bacterium]|nr:hypothetical protein [Planctomycetota bacterium]